MEPKKTGKGNKRVKLGSGKANKSKTRSGKKGGSMDVFIKRKPTHTISRKKADRLEKERLEKESGDGRYEKDEIGKKISSFTNKRGGKRFVSKIDGGKKPYQGKIDKRTPEQKKLADRKWDEEPLEKVTDTSSSEEEVKVKKADEKEGQEGVRLNKYVAQAGVCSRRQADEHIRKGFVTVNGEVMKEMGYKVGYFDVVTFKGKKVSLVENMVYLLMNKPKNHITTTSDEKGRKTVMDIAAKFTKERIYPVGRLDRNTTGLLILTNDGDLAHKLSHPSHEIRKLYHAVLDKPVTAEHIKAIKKGLKLEDGVAKVDKVSHVTGKGQEEVGIEIHIGKNRIVRRIFEHLGYEVIKLDRMIYAGLTKKDLPRGRCRKLTKQEVIFLKHFS